ncbi:MAG: 2-oxo acid dehydrogenase subunit E2 [Spirochaetia bacterium]|jgi:pyruvate dehydrogenase E2 component (dihydrolipoamide acetyltransferase)|nr:2-oxo acid dehydrogenase subunit E2 [Spirochaetia bacterium]
MEKILVPDLGGFDKIEIIEMFVSEGDTVKKETSLFSLESDKAVMDIPSPFAGVLKKLLVSAGDKVSPGDIIGEIEVPESDTVKTTDEKKSVLEQKKEPEEIAVKKTTEVQVSPTTPKDVHIIPDNFQSRDAVFHASPSVRQYARDLEIDLSRVVGTGPKNRISKEDLKNYIKEGLNSGGGGRISSGIPTIPLEDFSIFGRVEVIELTRIKRITGERLSAAWLNIPHVTQFDEADISDLEAFRKEQNMNVLSFIIKASAAALKKFIYFNSSLGEKGENLVLKDYINIGIAVDTEKGLVVPVIKDVDKKQVSVIMEELKEKSDLARKGRLKPEDFQGGSFTISSLGGISGTGFTPIVNAPQAAILGVSRSAMKPVWNGTEFKPRLILPFSVSYDHRIIDGAEAARFTRYLGSLLEDMRRVIL